MSRSWWIALGSSLALLALQWLDAFFGPAHEHVPGWLVPAFLSLPLLLPLALFALRSPRAPLWAGIAALFYFCMGIANFRVTGSPLDLADAALSVVVVFAAGWPGIAAKIAKRKAARPPTV